MDTQTIVKSLTTLSKILSLVTGVASYKGFIPSKWLPVAALVFSVASTLKDSVNHLIDTFTNPPKGS